MCFFQAIPRENISVEQRCTTEWNEFQLYIPQHWQFDIPNQYTHNELNDITYLSYFKHIWTSQTFIFHVDVFSHEFLIIVLLSLSISFHYYDTDHSKTNKKHFQSFLIKSSFPFFEKESIWNFDTLLFESIQIHFYCSNGIVDNH